MRRHLAILAVSLIAVEFCETACAADDTLPAGALVRLGSAKFRLPQGAATLTFSPDSKQLISGDNQGNIQAWEVATGKVLRSWKMSQSNVIFMRFSPDGKRLGVSSTYWYSFFDTKTGAPKGGLVKTGIGE